MEAQGDEGTVRHRRKLVVLGTALPTASEARHSGHRLAPTGKGLPTRLPRSGLVQTILIYGRCLVSVNLPALEPRVGTWRGAFFLLILTLPRQTGPSGKF